MDYSPTRRIKSFTHQPATARMHRLQNSQEISKKPEGTGASSASSFFHTYSTSICHLSILSHEQAALTGPQAKMLITLETNKQPRSLAFLFEYRL
jgi:hypothetical protein